MNSIEFLTQLRELGVGVQLDGERLRLRAPAGVLTSELREQVTAHRDGILTFLRQSANRTAPAIERVPRDGPLELSFAQERLWFLNELEPDSPEYHRPVALRLDGDLDVPALHAALREVVARHEVLRTTIRTSRDGLPRQLIRPAGGPDIPLIDLSSLPPERAEGQAKQWVSAESVRPFDLAADPPLRASLLRLGKCDHILVLVIHHIAIDQHSVGILRAEISALYGSFRDGQPSPLPELPIQYADYAAWQRQRLSADVVAGHLDYWRRQLADLPLVDLATDRPRRPARSAAGAYEFDIPPSVADGLRIVARRGGASMFMTTLAGFQALLARYAGQDDIAVGTPVTGRTHPDTRSLIGFFVNTLVLRADLTADPTFTDFLTRVRRTALDAYAQQNLPFEKLVDELQPHRSRGRNPLFDILFSYFAENRGSRGAGSNSLAACDFPISYSATTFDLSLEMIDTGGRLHCALEYSADLFDAETVERFAGHLTQLLHAVAADPDCRLSQISLSTPAERAQLTAWADGGPAVDTALVPELFDARARATPDHSAIITDDFHLTYGELAARVDQVAGHLVRRGVRPETVVAVVLKPGTEAVTALLGILKAGGVYLPLDPDLPAARRDFALRDSGASIVLAEADFPIDGPVGVASAQLSPDSGAYLLYTSGSTGMPKAVINRHGALANRLAWQAAAHQITAMDRILHKTPLSFDVSLWEICGTLIAGATIVLAPDGAHRDPVMLADLVDRHCVTMVDFVPSMLGPFLDANPSPSLRTVTCGGESLPGPLARGFNQRLGREARLYNMYGPTEACIDVTSAHCEPDSDRPPPIGSPHPGIVCHVLDKQLAPAPVRGELFVGGAGIARGYHGRPALTAAHFVADPVAADGSRLYRTGDRARWNGDGQLEFLGRIDGQLKVRGHRVEPAEIEHALLSHPAVSAAAVIPDPADPARLVAYLTGEPAIPTALRGHLKDLLPEHFIPAAYVFLDHLPTTAGGKVDRRALPSPSRAEEVASTATANKLEVQLAEIWRDVLGLGEVGIHDDFFELGGHSLLALQVVARTANIGLRITATQIFDHPTVAELATVAEPLDTSPADQDRLTGPLELLPIHRWWASLRTPHPDHFNQATWLAAATRLDLDLLRRAAKAVADHHDILRVRATGYPDDLLLTISDDSDPSVHLHQHSGTDCSDALARIADEAQAELDLKNGPVWRIELVETDEPGSRLFVVAHHLTVDTVSWRILEEDLARAYGQLANGDKADLGPKTTSAAQWARAVTEAPPNETRSPAMLPIDHETGPLSLRHTAVHPVSLTVDATTALVRRAPAAYRTQVNDLLLAALVRAVHRWTGTDAVTIDLEGHGRGHAEPHDLTRTMGWFTTFTPVDLPHADDPATLIKTTKESLRAARQPTMRPQIIFNYHGQFDGGGSERPTSLLRGIGGPTGTDVHPDTPLSHLLDVSAAIAGGRLHVRLTYPTTRFRPATMEAFGRDLHDALTELIDHAATAVPGAATPSDFPLARLSQADIDHLVATTPYRIDDAYPLSPMQHGMFFHTLADPDTYAYFEHTVLTFDGPVDVARLRDAVRMLIDRHPILRTAIRHHDQDIALQLVVHHVEIPWTECDAVDLDEFLAADRTRGFDLSQPPLIRFSLIHHDHRQSLVIAEHHLLMDGWSLPLFLDDLLALYYGTAAPPPRRPYRDYIAWLATNDLAESAQFWREQLVGFTRPSLLATEPPRAQKGHAAYHWRLADDMVTRLHHLGRVHHLTLNSLVRGALAVLISHETGQEDVCYGATVAGRPDSLSGAEHMLGLFINTLPIRTRVTGPLRVVDFLQSLQSQQLAQQSHEHTPLTTIQAHSQLPAGGALFDTILLFNNYPVDESQRPGAAGQTRICDVRTIEYDHYPLTVVTDPSLVFKISYHRSRFTEPQIHRIGERLTALLAAIADDPHGHLDELTPITAFDREQLEKWECGPAADLPSGCVPDWIQAQARRTPAAAALVHGQNRLTYADLQRRANDLADRLYARGVRQEAVVAILLDRGPDLIAAMLAVWRCGAAYLPLDPDILPERLNHALTDSRATLVITQTRFSLPTGETFLLDGPPANTSAGPNVSVHPDAVAYLIYTSGSTGLPKAVAISHGALAHHVHAMAKLFALTGQTQAMQGFSPGFDAAAEEIFPILTTGGTLHLTDQGWPESPRFTAYVEQAALTLLHLPAAYWANWLSTAPPERLPAVRLAKIGGERPRPAHIRQWYAATGIPLWNVYGPTETTITVTAGQLPADLADSAVPPIGRPLPGTTCRVLDAHLRPLRPGGIGELFVGGGQLARGYHRHPALTAERFVCDPVAADGSRLYRTGDLVRWNGSGELEYLGRADRQLKLRGHRVEPAEIEQALLSHPAVGQAAVVLRDDRLIAYIAASSDTEDLRAYLSARLPAALIPGAFVTLPELALTANGKTDHAALPEPASAPPHAGRRAQSPTEQLAAEIWEQVLGVQNIGVHDDFFTLGGHSLVATQIIARLRAALEVDLPVAAIFDAPTVAGLAAVIDATARTSPAPPIIPMHRTARPELSFAQQRMWFLNQLEPTSAEYNTSTALRLPSADTAAIGAALTAVVRRHEILRTTIRTDSSGIAWQQITPPGDVSLPVADLSDLPPRNAEEAARTIADADAARPFDLAIDAPLRARLVLLPGEACVLILTLHHIASDQWSTDILTGELAELLAAGEPAALPFQYADYAGWQREWLTGQLQSNQLDYWRRQLATLPALNLPTDRPRPPVRDPAGAVCRFTVPAETTGALKALSRRSHASMFMTLLAGFQALLSRYCGQDDIAVGTPIAGRSQPGLAGLIGFFVNTLVIRTNLSGDPAFTELLSRVRRVALEAYAHQDVPFESVVDELRPERDRARTPLFDVMFTYDTPSLEGDLADRPDLCGFPVSFTATPFDLTMNLADVGSVLGGTVEYTTAIFDASTIDRLIANFLTLLESLAARPDERISALAILSPDERELLRSCSEGLPTEPAPAVSITDLICGDRAKPAVITDDTAITYGELEDDSNRLADHLRSLGVRNETVVAINLGRDPRLVTALLAVLKAGGVYLLLDSQSPPERLEFQIKDSGAALVITELKLAECADTSATRTPRHPDAGAYLIYTSGSSGTPKPTLGTHRNLVQLFHAWQHTHGLRADDVWLTTANVSFDVFTGDWVRALASGATLVIGPDRRRLDPETLAGQLTRHQITAFETTPHQLGALRDYYVESGVQPPGLRLMIVASDRWPGADYQPTREMFSGTQLLTAYGLTETTIDSTWQVATDRDTTQPVGRTLPYATVRVLDTGLHTVPVGVVGEIHLGGPGITRGYPGHPALTAGRFVADPYAADGSRLCRTGDLGRWNCAGELDLLGRADQQINLRGHRIEPAEIERAIMSHPSVRTAAVVLRADRLVAYIVTDSTPTTTELRNHLANLLPDHMIPSVFTTLSALPLTATGKLDRLALPEPAAVRPRLDIDYAEPSSPAERLLANLWREVLRVDQVGVRDDFFELGGDSIQSMQVVTRARAAGLRITPAQLFDNPTVASLAAVAELIEQVHADQDRLTGPIPLLPIHRWWAAQQLPHPEHFNQAMWLRSSVRLRLDLVERAAAALADQHDILRVRAYGYPEQLRLEIAADNGGVVGYHQLPADCDLRSRLERIAAAAQSSLDLEHGPVWRLELVDTAGEDGSRLLIVAHHLTVDTVSWQILEEDLQQAYAQLAAGAAVDLGPKTTSVAQWAAVVPAAHQRTPPTPQLPIDHETGPVTFQHAVTHQLMLDESVAEAFIRRAPAAYRTRVNDLLLAALSRAIFAWRGLDTVLVDLEGHGRTHSDPHDLSRTLGWFTRFTSVALGHEDDPAALVKTTKERLRAAQPGAGTAQIIVNYHGQLDGSPSTEDSEPSLLRPVAGPTGFDMHPDTPLPHLLEVSGAVGDGRLGLHITYPSTRYRAATIDALAVHLEEALTYLVRHCAQTVPGAATPSDFPLATLNQAEVDQLVATTPYRIADAYPLSPMQQGMLFHTLLDPDAGVYFEQTVITFTGVLDQRRLRAAAQQLVDRHPILRTAVRHHDQDTPLQLVAERAAMPWDVVDTTDLDEFLAADRTRGFDLSQPPLMRFTLLRHAADQHSLVVAQHHLLLDGWSVPLFLDDLLRLYHGSGSLPARRPYRDYISWLAARKASDDGDFWRDQLAGFQVATPLATEPALPQTGQATYRWQLSPESTALVDQLGRTHRVTLSTVMRAALALLVSHHTCLDDVCYGATVAGRPDSLPGAENMLGLFINTLPVRTQVSADLPALDFLRKLQDQALHQQPYEHTSLTTIQAHASLPANTPLFDTILVVHNYPSADVSADESGSACAISGEEAYDHYPMTVTAIAGPSLQINFAYDRSRFTPERLDRMSRHLTVILESLATEPDQLLGAISPIPQAELNHIVRWESGPAVAFGGLVHERIAMRAAEIPDSVAVVAGDQQLNYRQLESRANQLAHRLRSMGVGPEVVVGVVVDRCLELVPLLLGIWKAGGVYLPLDPDAPAERLAFQLADSSAAVLVGTSAIVDRISTDVPQLLLSDSTGTTYSTKAPDVPAHGASGAYLIYTSGSTGQPKAVLNHHAGLANRVLWQIEAHRLGPSDRILHKTPLVFDVSLWELCCPLLAGGTVVMAPPGEHRDPAALVDLIRRHDITAIEFVPSLLGPFLEIVRADDCPVLRFISCAGEALPAALVDRVHERLDGVEVHNLYGPAEAAIEVTAAVCPPGAGLPTIGVPLPNTSIFLLDRQMRRVATGVPGELHIGGVQAARGYHDRPELTAERFVPSPFESDGARLYRTGDLARWRDDGQLEFLGRTDQQVKIRGHRIEPGEVERTLLAHPQIVNAAVTVSPDAIGQPRLVGYVVSTGTISVSEVRAYALAHLPVHLVPGSFTVLDALPLTPSGKTNYLALPAVDDGRPDLSASYAPASTLAEQVLAGFWQEVLGVDRVGVNDNFFELGGHSLLATQVAVRLRTRLGIEVPLVTLFDAPVLGGLAERVEDALIDKIERLTEDEVRQLLRRDADSA